MSSLYNLEPQPTAQVLLETNSGEILLDLFAKQTPLASRNFLQLCLDGYYTNTIFHRLVPGFILQGGDPTGTGSGGEAIYDGGLFEDEFHSRLKFNRRGLLGMANSGRKSDNGSQFFLTLGAASELDGRNTMFGRVVGDTIYNLMKMGEAELAEGQGERPLYPTRITGAKVLVNPFEDMVQRTDVGKEGVGVKEGGKAEKHRGKKKGGKALLSFGIDEGDDNADASPLKKEKFNSKLVTQQEVNGAARNVEKSMDKAIRKKISRSPSPNPSRHPSPSTPVPFSENKRTSRSQSRTLTPEESNMRNISSLLERTNAQIDEMKASMKRSVVFAPKEKVRKKSALEEMIPASATRGRKRKHGINGDTSKDLQTLDILNAFREKLENAPPEITQAGSPTHSPSNEQDTNDKGTPLETMQDNPEAELCDLHFIVNCESCQSWDKHLLKNAIADDGDSEGWLSHSLSFDKDRLGKDLNWKKKNEEELVVIDPREKTKDIMEENRAKKIARKGTGPVREWDRDREKGRVLEKRQGQKVS